MAEVFRIIHKKCFKCKKYNAKPFKAPEVPPLPEFRITPSSHPFENTGLDIFGPVYILVDDEQTKGYKKVKRWVLLLTCLVIRAIHLEILVGMDTMDIICAIKRFTARRGTPALILSDNAPQFHLVNGCLQELWKTFFEDNRSNTYFAENNITWKFTPQNAPWMGGAYERLVQVTKNAFRRTYGEQSLTEREFNTSITEIEGVINSRPITYVDKELSTPLLSPNHFLRVATPAIPIDISERDQHHLSKKERVLEYWKAAEESLNVYWRIWSEQYLLALREVKSKQADKNQLQPKVGEVVLMIDPTQKRGYWRKAVVERLIQSADGRHRSAQIRLATGNRMIRPLVKLASLELLDVLPEDQRPSVVVSGEDVDASSTDPSGTDEGPAPVVMFLRSSSPII